MSSGEMVDLYMSFIEGMKAFQRGRKFEPTLILSGEFI